MSTLQIILLAAIQGAAELLPVSSSAHVIAAERLMGLDPSSPELTFLLVMLHTGTMFAVLLYFWKRWATLLRAKNGFIRAVVIATAVTGVVGLLLKVLIEKVILVKLLGHSKGEIESLFRFLPLIATSLFVVGLYIIYAGRKSAKTPAVAEHSPLSDQDSAVIGLVQALCLPFRGLSRSGSTISTALLRRISRSVAEDFSFALAVVLTPPVILLELRRLLKASNEHAAVSLHDLAQMLQPGLLGMVFSFLAGLLALKWLSRWLENGKWTYFGYYCLFAAAIVLCVHFTGATPFGNTSLN
jgi:undecaprenyl-diphosphatase